MGRPSTRQVRVGHHSGGDVLAGNPVRIRPRLITRKCGLLSPLRQEVPLHAGRRSRPPPRPAQARRSATNRDDLVTRTIAERALRPAAWPGRPAARRYPSMVKMSGWSQWRGQQPGSGCRSPRLLRVVARPVIACPVIACPVVACPVVACGARLGRGSSPAPWRSSGPTRFGRAPRPGPCVAWSSLKPARIRAASRQVTSRSGPGSGSPGSRARRSSASWRGRGRASCCRRNSQFTIITGGVHAGSVALQVLQG